jgi:hypothetical protein
MFCAGRSPMRDACPGMLTFCWQASAQSISGWTTCGGLAGSAACAVAFASVTEADGVDGIGQRAKRSAAPLPP